MSRGLGIATLEGQVKILTGALSDLGERLEKLHQRASTPWLDRAGVASRMGIHVKVLDRIRREDPDFPTPSYPLQSPRWKIGEIDAYMESRRGRREA